MSTANKQKPGLAYDEEGHLLIDVRGPRFGASITTVVLAAALIIQGPVGVAIVAFQVTMFAISSIAGLAYSPYGNIFRFVKKRFDLGPPPATEHEAPPRFAQVCGLVVGGAGLVVLLVAGSGSTVGWVLVGLVLALSTLLASTGICVGCELYLAGVRLRGRGATS